MPTLAEGLDAEDESFEQEDVQQRKGGYIYSPLERASIIEAIVLHRDNVLVWQVLIDESGESFPEVSDAMIR